MRSKEREREREKEKGERVPEENKGNTKTRENI